MGGSLKVNIYFLCVWHDGGGKLIDRQKPSLKLLVVVRCARSSRDTME